MSTRKLLFSLFALLMLIQSCNKKKDPFYSSNCGYDCIRVPLLKPYYLGSTTGVDGEWNLSGIPSKGSIDVSYICVLDSIIVSYYFNKYIVLPENRDTTWYVHIPSTGQEYRFSSEKEFHNQVVKFSKHEVKFDTPSSLYKQLIDKGYLEWFPKEYK